MSDRDSDDDLMSDEDMQPSVEDYDDDEEALDFISDEDPERKASAGTASVAYTILDRDRLATLQVHCSLACFASCARQPSVCVFCSGGFQNCTLSPYLLQRSTLCKITDPVLTRTASADGVGAVGGGHPGLQLLHGARAADVLPVGHGGPVRRPGGARPRVGLQGRQRDVALGRRSADDDRSARVA